jgi:hypothetical protein
VSRVPPPSGADLRAFLGAAAFVALTARPAAAQKDSLASVPEAYRTRITVLPYVTYTPQTRIQLGVAGGVQFKWPGTGIDLATRPSYFAGNVAYTTRGQWLTYFENSVYTPTNRWWLFGRAGVGYFPLFYYGIGPYTTRADTNLMKHRFLLLEGKAVRRVSGDLYAGLHYRLESFFDVEWQFPNRIVPELPGAAGGHSSGLGATVQLDARNSATTPTRGHFVLLDYLRQAEWLGSDFDYDQVVFDARLYLPVRAGRDVLALNLYGEWNGADVPIQSMARLSDYSSAVVARGVYLGRFRDRHELIAQADYRGHLKSRFGYVVFGSAGNVFGSAGAGLFDRMKYTYGVGLRYNVNPADPLNLRVDYTLTSFGESGLSVGAAEAF